MKLDFRHILLKLINERVLIICEEVRERPINKRPRFCTKQPRVIRSGSGEKLSQIGNKKC